MGKIFDASAILKVADRFREVPKRAEQARSRAASTLARRLPVEARRDIQDEYNLTAGRINKGLSVRTTSEYVELVGASRGIGRIEFGGRRGANGQVTYQVHRNGARQVLPHAFIANGLSGNTQIFERLTHKRLPIQAIYGPSIAQMLRKSGREERLIGFSQTLLSAEIERLFGS